MPPANYIGIPRIKIRRVLKTRAPRNCEIIDETLMSDSGIAPRLRNAQCCTPISLHSYSVRICTLAPLRYQSYKSRRVPWVKPRSLNRSEMELLTGSRVVPSDNGRPPRWVTPNFIKHSSCCATTPAVIEWYRLQTGCWSGCTRWIHEQYCLMWCFHSVRSIIHLGAPNIQKKRTAAWLSCYS